MPKTRVLSQANFTNSLGGVEFWKASLKRILSFGFGLQVQSGDVFGFWVSRLTVGVSGIEGSS